MRDTQRAFDTAEEIWRPIREAADNARNRYDVLSTNDDGHDPLVENSRLPEQLVVLQQQLDALDIWRRWAAGGDITIDSVTRAVGILDAANDRHHQTLADTLTCVSPELITQPPAPEIGVTHNRYEVGLGIDF